MPSYKLIYFNGRGRAELCRLLFAFAGQEFEDCRMDSDKWKAFKENTLVGQLPVMEIDGKQFSQSSALAQFLAREFGLYGKNNTEALRIDEITAILQDLFTQVIKVFFAKEGEKESALKEFEENQSPKFLKALETLLERNGSEFFVGKGVTLADVAVYDMTYSMCIRFPKFLEKYPKLDALKEKIGSMDNIKKYVDKRPVTEF